MDEGRFTCSVGNHKCHQVYRKRGTPEEYCDAHRPEEEEEV